MYAIISSREFRVFGRLVLIPFLEGRRSPDGIDAQQRAEIRSEEVFSWSSSAIGMIVGLSQQLDHILKTRTQEIASILAQSLPDLDDRCLKNYGLLISNAENAVFSNLFGLLIKCRLTTCMVVVYEGEGGGGCGRGGRKITN